MLGGKCIAVAKSCSLQIQTQTDDASTKDDTNDWSKIEVTGKSWSVQTESLVVDSDPEGTQGKSTVELFSLVGTSVALVFDVTNGANNRNGTNSSLKKSGNAYLTDLNLTAANRQNATVSCTFTGNGALS